MSGTGRPLLAARASSGEATKDGAGSTTPPSGKQPGGRPKRTLIESACSACRRRKSRCDGQRPTCSRCQNLRTDCQYEAEEGESRWSALRRRNHILETEREQVRELFAFVRSRSEPEALEVFHRIRRTSYEDVFGLLQQIKDGTLSAPMMSSGLNHPPPGVGMIDQQPRLPPIQAILEPPGRVLQPATSLSLSSEDSRASSSNPEFAPLPLHLSSRGPLETLEPSPSHSQMLRPAISLSSEESAGSMTFDLKNTHSTP